LQLNCVRIESFGYGGADVKEVELSFKAKILLAALVLVVIVYISTVSYTVLGSDSDKPITGQRDIFDPVTLRTIGPVGGSVSELSLSGNVMILPSIRIPVRPAIRSPYRPLWISDQQIEAVKK
jgi:hypothetical protein